MNDSQELRHILVIEDQKSRRVTTLKETTYCIGRDTSCPLILYDRQVSRQHATLLRVIDYQQDNYYYRIIDGNLQGKRSTNGIIVNGKYCLSHELKDGDNIRFGGQSRASYHIVHNNKELDLIKSGEPNEKLPVSSILTKKESNSAILVQEEKHEDNARLESALSSSFKKAETAKATLVIERIKDEINKDSLIAEFSPEPIIEISYSGQITYMNPAASIKFPNLTLEHPILNNIINELQNIQDNPVVREINVGLEYYKQYIKYLPDKSLIRIYIIDQTLNKQLENQVKSLQNRYQNLIEQTLEGIFWIDAKTKRVIDVNTSYCQILGYTKEELINKTVYDLILMEASIIDNDLAQTTRNKSYFVEESVHLCKNGSLITVEMKISFTNNNGKDNFCFVIRDISEKNTQKISRKIKNFMTH